MHLMIRFMILHVKDLLQQLNSSVLHLALSLLAFNLAEALLETF